MSDVRYTYAVITKEITIDEVKALPNGTQFLVYNPFLGHMSMDTMHPKNRVLEKGNKLAAKFHYFAVRIENIEIPNKQ